jgi:hypothetical protein
VQQKAVGYSHPPPTKPPSRYAPKTFLSVLMIHRFPHVVLNAAAGGVADLCAAADILLGSWAMVLAAAESGVGVGVAAKAFDAAWQVYVQRFRLWKGEDAKFLERELVQAAGRMESSMLSKLRSNLHPSNEEAIRTQVATDHALLEERVRQLTGDDGVTRMHAHLAEVRRVAVDAGVADATREDGNPDAVHHDADRPLNNEQLVYELLHNPRWQLPAPDSALDEVRRRRWKA